MSGRGAGPAPHQYPHHQHPKDRHHGEQEEGDKGPIGGADQEYEQSGNGSFEPDNRGQPSKSPGIDIAQGDRQPK